MRILLIQPPLNPNLIGSGIINMAEPLALETVGAAIVNEDVKILDMRIENSLEETLEKFSPHLVGLTAYTPDVYNVYRILKKVKSFNKKILTIVGGHHATLMPEDFNKDFIDVIVLGPGEETIKRIVSAFDNKKDFDYIPNIAMQNSGELRFNKNVDEIVSLDDSPIPARYLTQKYRKNYFRGIWRPVASMMTSRGCPYRCNFCAVWVYEKGRYRVRSPRKVLEELKGIEEEYISICDDNSLHDFRRAQEIYELIKYSGIKKRYKLISRADSIMKHPEIIEKWKEIGLDLVLIGFESFKDDELNFINKRSSVKINEEAMNILHKNGIVIISQFMINPDYTEGDFQALGDYVERFNLCHPIFTVLTPLPGTELYKEKYNQLLTHNYELYDFIHSVLPTFLPREKFYECFINLYKRCYNIGNSPFSKGILDNVYDKLQNASKLEEAPLVC